MQDSPSLAPLSSIFDGVRDDLLIFDQEYGVLICKLCQYAIVPDTVRGHLRAIHQKEEGLTTAQIKILARRCLTYPARPPSWIQEMVMPAKAPIHPLLRLQPNRMDSAAGSALLHSPTFAYPSIPS